MTLSFRARQAATVTVLVLGAMLTLGSINLASLLRISLEESRARGELLADALFHRARLVVQGGREPRPALRDDPGIRAILESSIAYTESVTYAAIVTSDGIAIAHSSPLRQGQPQAEGVSLDGLLEQGPIGQVASVYRDTTLEVAEPMLLGDTPFGSIRIGLSPVLIRRELQQALRPAVTALLVALSVGLIASLMLARWALKPIHMIRAGLTQLGQGETAAPLELPPGKDFSGFSESFEAISARLSDRGAADAPEPVESLVERVEDAVSVLDKNGSILFANTAMRAALPDDAPADCLMSDTPPEQHPYRRLVREAIDTGRPSGPLTVSADAVSPDAPAQSEYTVACHPYHDSEGAFGGLVLTARDIGYLSSVHSTMESSRQVASLGRLLAGVAHEVKNPLNAMTIHLELIRQKLLQAFEGAPEAASSAPSVLGLRTVEDDNDDGEPNPVDTTLTVATAPKPSGEPRQLLQHVTTISDEVKRRMTSSGSSSSTTPLGLAAAGSAYRWCTVSSSSTAGISRSNRRSAAARVFGSPSPTRISSRTMDEKRRMTQLLARSLLTAMWVLAVSTAAGGCAVFGAMRGSPPPPLEVPAAAARLVATYPVDPAEPEAPVVDTAELKEEPIAEPVPEPAPEPEPVAAPAPEPAPAPPTDVQADLPELRPAPPEDVDAATVSRRLMTTGQILAGIDRSMLDATGRAQHDTARRFHDQATAALAAGSIRFAFFLNDKAETLARDLQAL